MRRSTFSVCAPRRGGANPARKGGGNSAPPSPCTLRAQEGGANEGRTSREGGIQTHSLHPPSPSLHPRSHAALRAKGEGADVGGRGRKGRVVLTFSVYWVT